MEFFFPTVNGLIQVLSEEPDLLFGLKTTQCKACQRILPQTAGIVFNMFCSLANIPSPKPQTPQKENTD